MSFERHLEGLDYAPCRYAGSRLTFRGPPADLRRPYVAVVGACEAFGCYVRDPFPARLGARLGHSVVNLGVRNASLDAFLKDDAALHVIAGAAVVVVQAMSAANLSNRFYVVHARRNDRFLAQSSAMEALFPTVDFSEFAFTQHLLTTLRAQSADRFRLVETELRTAWRARMRTLLDVVRGPAVVLAVRRPGRGVLGRTPLLVTDQMIADLAGDGVETVACACPAATPADLAAMVFPETEVARAQASLPPSAHAAIADALLPHVAMAVPTAAE